ncbi:peptidyl-prolyl cis-trans isomerase, cyclophilin-type [Psychroflexus torquis ATCC 700755]|uniref:Peptidyl-prolyl cis-trans isomerase n=1 Tax=Psychroflexus torquis (strain ATCC 700755 / CIP 106069 / ACAM 623) TaxID=313595 RepID=K4IID3_PSYTT|nr:peptidylprolyl isomerase [Psychroflexus torquis]AFU70094.1 peptidyl-prolyl cis-trans isomerase, cyclophilin-type [Psychroflexus torquis ATCC 700755]
MKIPFLILSIVFVFTSCKENKDNSTIQSSLEKKMTEKKVEVNIPSNGQSDRDLSKIKTITQEELIPFLKAYAEDNPETIVEVITDKGSFTVELYAEPILHRANFIRLVKVGYFDTTVFHRVANNFVIQGGNSDRMGTYDFRNALGNFLIPNEFISRHKHDYGTLSAAKYAEQNISNASSPFEFFIVTKLDGAYHLDQDHTVFGRVIKGMEVIEKIDDMETDGSEWPLTNVGLDMKVIR